MLRHGRRGSVRRSRSGVTLEARGSILVGLFPNREVLHSDEPGPRHPSHQGGSRRMSEIARNTFST